MEDILSKAKESITNRERFQKVFLFVCPYLCHVPEYAGTSMIMCLHRWVIEDVCACMGTLGYVCVRIPYSGKFL